MNIGRLGITENAKIRGKVIMKNCKAGYYWLAAKSGLCALLVSYSGVQAQAGNTATINFTGTIVAGTCNLTAPATVNLGDVDPTKLISTQWHYENITPFALQITGCTGVGGATMAPEIQITGTLSTDMGQGNNWVFKNPASTSKGFGVVLLPASGPYNSDSVTANNGWLSIPGFGKGTTPTANTFVHLNAAVSCGRSTWCPRANSAAGTLNASLTFTFAYK